MTTLKRNWPEEIESVLNGIMNSVQRDQTFYAGPAERHLQKLKSVADSIGANFDSTPKVCAEDYVSEYKDFLDRKRQEIEPFAIRQLCWNNDVATDRRFLNYIHSKHIRLDARSLRGLIYSIHRKWTKRDLLHNEISIVDSLIRNYAGINKAINRWKHNLAMILGTEAHVSIAKELSEAKPKVNDHFKELNVYAGTEFYVEVVKKAITWAVERTSKRQPFASAGALSPLQEKRDDLNYVLNELVSLEQLPRETFRESVARIVLDEGIQREKELVVMVTDYILENKLLGDPRMPRNDIFWAGFDEAAKSKIIEWLSSEDIVFFFQHVLRDNSEQHQRKDFWLRYVKRLRKSRCWLSDRARNELRSIKKGTQIQGYGSLRSPPLKAKDNRENSVFVLDFGKISCVEFSEVGAIYVYQNDRLPRALKDFWSPTPLVDSDFRNKRLLRDEKEDCIWHSGRGWTHKIGNRLAFYGINAR